MSGGGLEILLTTDFREAGPCVSVQCSGPRLVLPLQSSNPRAFGLESRGDASPTLGEGKW